MLTHHLYSILLFAIRNRYRSIALLINVFNVTNVTVFWERLLGLLVGAGGGGGGCGGWEILFCFCFFQCQERLLAFGFGFLLVSSLYIPINAVDDVDDDDGCFGPGIILLLL